METLLKNYNSKLYFDQDDYLLLEMLHSVRQKKNSNSQIRNLFDPYLHPRGIKELSAPKSIRIASAMIDLLGTLETGSSIERLCALRAVREEVLHDISHTMRLNAGRVLLQIMKEIVRANSSQSTQLALAHDFSEASSGKPRLIRKQLHKYFLLEMPEQWNQLAFDHHVHDANTKGRKSPTHLIMDAWIKGIRFLGVFYYNFIRPEVAAELLQAAEIMEIDVRIGVEVSAILGDKYAHLVWIPRGFLSRVDFINFLNEPEVKGFMARGIAVAEYEKQFILQMLRSFNRNHLCKINQRFGLEVPDLDESEFLDFVASGQASLIHLAEFAHSVILFHLQNRMAEISNAYADLSEDKRKEIRDWVDSANQLVPEFFLEEYMRLDLNPKVPDPSIPHYGPEVPEMLRMSPSEILDEIEKLPCRSRVTLNPSNLSPADVLEVLYQGRGRVTHLEIFNLKDWAQGLTQYRSTINNIRLVINSGNVVKAKQLLHNILLSIETSGTAYAAEQRERITMILRNLSMLLNDYCHDRLRSRMGSDSTGRSRQSRGMGFAVIPTLPLRTRLQLYRDRGRIVPVSTVPQRHETRIIGNRSGEGFDGIFQGQTTIGRHWGEDSPNQVTWSLGGNTTTLSKKGNIVSLGGVVEQSNNGFAFYTRDNNAHTSNRPDISHLNTGVLNMTKIAIGFVPAFLTFYATKQWWFLAYFGAVIWFAITGLRNILQSVIGGGGLIRTSLLGWKDYVSWSRVADSLMFTGFSVPLLDLLIKDLILAKSFNITTATSPFFLYSAMALANGLYISTHNIYRGLPLTATLWNFFRTVLSIPVALVYNFTILKITALFSIPTELVLSHLQLWAAVISKAASDCVAAIIEGYADRQHNLTQATFDYQEKLAKVYEVFGRLEMLYPEDNVLKMLEQPKQLAEELQKSAMDVLRLMVINSLDLLYFYMYQPCADTALRHLLRKMSEEEIQVIQLSQMVLTRKRLVSEMLLNGLIGKRFEQALSFYLFRTDRYLATYAKLIRQIRKRNGI